MQSLFAIENEIRNQALQELVVAELTLLLFALVMLWLYFDPKPGIDLIICACISLSISNQVVDYDQVFSLAPKRVFLLKER